MKVLIVEDEIYNFNSLCKALTQIEPSIEIDGPVTNIEDMKTALQRQSDYTVIFSDIRLDDGLCFEAFERIEVTTPVIFTTAYDEYALEAFQNNGLAYLLKPIDTQDLAKALEKAKHIKLGSQDLAALLKQISMREEQSYRSRFLIQDYDGAHILDVNDINHIAKDGEKTTAYLNDGSIQRLQYESLDEVASMLDPRLFFRANRQYIINIHSIQKIRSSFHQTQKIKLKGYPDLDISVSKDKVSKLRDWIEK